MAWTKTPNSAMFKGANWGYFIKKVSNCTPELAKRIAFQNNEITFFFFCRESMVLEGPIFDKYGPFNANDALFFSGEPWYGSAPQCDSYLKKGITTVYINPSNSQQFRDISCNLLSDGSPAVDVVCIFAANYASNEFPYLRANNNQPATSEPFNANIKNLLIDNSSVKFLQDKGITVLLTVLNGHANVGWSQFTNEAEACVFAEYLKKEVIDKYGLDGIDIDDEYSDGQANDTSLIMVTSIMKKIIPDKLITKALFADESFFSKKYEGMTLAQQLTYGWEMSYGGNPASRLPFYAEHGMAKNIISCGFWIGASATSDDLGNDVKWIKDNGYAGIMIFEFEQSAGQSLTGQLVNDLFGPGNWIKNPQCES